MFWAVLISQTGRKHTEYYRLPKFITNQAEGRGKKLSGEQNVDCGWSN